MKYKTRQELFDNAWRGFEAQGWERSIGLDEEKPMGLYRGPHNRKCAIGHSIPDAGYHVGMECRPVASARIWRAVGIDPSDMDWAVEFQKVHDSGLDEPLRPRMEKFAEKHHLTVPSTRDAGKTDGD